MNKKVDVVATAIKHLKRVDPILSPIIAIDSSMGVYQERSAFESLVRIIVGQQLSTKAAETIFDRTKGLVNGRSIAPTNVTDIDDLSFIRVGVSRAKLSTIRILADEILSGTLSLRKLTRLDDGEVHDKLEKIKGVGPWTVHMYLMSVLKRPDVFPSTDKGILRAIDMLYGKRRHQSTPDQIATKWRPYRSIACWHLWKYIDSLQ